MPTAAPAATSPIAASPTNMTAASEGAVSRRVDRHRPFMIMTFVRPSTICASVSLGFRRFKRSRTVDQTVSAVCQASSVPGSK
jgi:hypothetical protein